MMFWFALYYLAGVILNGAVVVYREFKTDEEDDTLLESIVRLCFFLIGVLYWPLFWALLIHDFIKARRTM